MNIFSVVGSLEGAKFGCFVVLVTTFVDLELFLE